MTHDPSVARVGLWPSGGTATLDAAYEVCAKITSHHSRSFYLASGLLPKDKRRAVRAFYAFCRRSDDIVDVADVDHGYSLDGWSAASRPAHPQGDDPVLMAWADVRARYSIPQEYIDDLLEGVRMDLTISRYATFEDLWLYCYRVAATVGLVSMHIVGFSSEDAIPYAIKSGVALQMTNILRDVGEDAERGRIYLPLEDLARFGYTEEDVAQGVIDDRLRSLLEFEMARTEALYDEGAAGIPMISPDGRFAIASALTMYRGILDRIRANGYDVFRQRAHVSTIGKLATLPRAWWQCRQMA